MKTTVTGIVFVCWLFVCWLAGSSSAWAIECMSAAGNPKSGYYAWREIDGRKCWFKKTGAMPPKSELHWPAKTQEQLHATIPAEASEETTMALAAPPREPAARSAGRSAAVAAPPPEDDATDEAEPRRESPAPQFAFKTIRVRPAAAAAVRLGDGQVDLMNGASVSAVPVIPPSRLPVIASPRPKPAAPASAAAASADPFEARFSGQ
jgi:hypothetical protein